MELIFQFATFDFGAPVCCHGETSAPTTTTTCYFTAHCYCSSYWCTALLAAAVVASGAQPRTLTATTHMPLHSGTMFTRIDAAQQQLSPTVLSLTVHASGAWLCAPWWWRSTASLYSTCMMAVSSVDGEECALWTGARVHVSFESVLWCILL